INSWTWTILSVINQIPVVLFSVYAMRQFHSRLNLDHSEREYLDSLDDLLQDVNVYHIFVVNRHRVG
ncbi:hypothetical protein PENTCL1PPCAC_10054, partial [Pristionchus entomophagus]